jgi:hypothetical protein
MTAATTDLPTPKQYALTALNNLPDDATWEDIRYSLYVVEKIDAGRRSARTERTYTNDEVRAHFGLEPLDR